MERHTIQSLTFHIMIDVSVRSGTVKAEVIHLFHCPTLGEPLLFNLLTIKDYLMQIAYYFS